MFWNGLTAAMPSSAHDAESAARTTAQVSQLLFGEVRLEREDSTWYVTVPLSPSVSAMSVWWGAGLEYEMRWLAEVNRLQGEAFGLQWKTRLDGTSVRMELTAA